MVGLVTLSVVPSVLEIPVWNASSICVHKRHAFDLNQSSTLHAYLRFLSLTDRKTFFLVHTICDKAEAVAEDSNADNPEG